MLQGLDILSRSIDQKSASLKVLVESNFERFVRAKTTIDNVYAEMRNQGVEIEPQKPRAHTRITSKSSNHFRSPSIQSPLSPGGAKDKPLPSDKKKHALTKESEYGTQGIKAPLIEVAVKAEEIWGPALGGREQEENLKQAQVSIENSQGIFDVNASIIDCIKRKDYNRLVEAYSRAKKYADDARTTAQAASSSQIPLTEAQVYLIVITGRMWTDVGDRIDAFKRDVWRRLTNTQAAFDTGKSSYDDHMAMISVLLELGVEDNPIWVWLLSRYDYLKNKISSTFERSRVEIEVLRRRLANDKKPTPQVAANLLKNSSRQGVDKITERLDTPQVIELWEITHTFISTLLSVQGGILGEVLDFWDKAQQFIDGKAQRTLPNGIDGTSRRHHRLSTDGVSDLQNGVVELVELLRENIASFFADPPIEDISMLFSPITPVTPNTPKSAVLTPYSQDTRFRFDVNNPPPPSPKRGELWEDFAFWPPYANSTGGVHYLGKIATLIGTAATEMAVLRPVGSASSAPEKLRALIVLVRERCARAVCAAWTQDADLCKYLEDWTRSSDRRDVTNLPDAFYTFENWVLSGLQKVLYIPEATSSKAGGSNIVSPPASKLLQMLRSHFITSLYKVMSGMVENAEKKEEDIENPSNGPQDEILVVSNGNSDGKVAQSRVGSLTLFLSSQADQNQNIRILLSLANLKHLSSNIIPSLTSQFETSFSVTLSDESSQLASTFSQIDSRLFTSYTAPNITELTTIVTTGIASPDWIPSTDRPTEVRSYVYQALLVLVNIHTELSTHAPPLLSPVLSHLNTHVSLAFLSAFKSRQHYALPALMQATLDVEFVAQTLRDYVSDKAGKIQGEIYEELDSRTDDGARNRLQKELPEMRAVLKRLREGMRGGFGCFRKPRIGR